MASDTNWTTIPPDPSASDVSSLTVGMTTMTPMPSTALQEDEDAVRLHAISPVLFGVVCALTFLGIVLATTFLIFNFKYRNHRLIKMSSPNLNIIIVLGTIVLYACVVLIGVDGNLTSSTYLLTIFCKVRLFLLICGFSLVYGSLFSKTWRVYRIFAHTGAKRMVIRDNRLVAITACLLIVDAFLVAMWLTLDPPECKARLLPVTSEDSVSENESLGQKGAPQPQTTRSVSVVPDAVHGCYSQYNEIWLLVVFTYKALVLLYGTHLSWATRNVALTAMNDARCIIASVYTCAILVSLMTALSTALWRWPNIWYACLSFVILTCTTEVLLLLHIPKIRAWKENQHINRPFARTLTSSFLATNHGQSFMQVEEELFLLSAENAALKCSLREKDDTIKMLQGHVGTAKEKLCQLIGETDGRQDSGCDFDGSSSATSQDDQPASNGIDQHTREKIVAGKPPLPDQERSGFRLNSPLKKKKKVASKTSKGTTTKALSFEEETNVAVIDLEDHLTIGGTTVALTPPTPMRSVGRNEGSSDGDALRRRKTRERASSLRSVGSTTSQLEELRNCIANELHCADHLSANLRDAIAQDLGACRQRPLYYDMARTEEDIMSSLSKSYNLRDDDDHSVASSTFTYDNPVFSRDQASRRSYSSRRTSKAASRQSSFRSVASIALEIAESYTRRDKHGNIKERELQWPSYIPPKDAKVRSGEPLRVVRSSEAPIVYTRSVYNTYV